jgi:hypothetical protein
LLHRSSRWTVGDERPVHRGDEQPDGGGDEQPDQRIERTLMPDGRRAAQDRLVLARLDDTAIPVDVREDQRRPEDRYRDDDGDLFPRPDAPPGGADGS